MWFSDLRAQRSGTRCSFCFFQCFQQRWDNCWSYSFFHFQPSTILHLYPRYRVKRPCDGSVFQLRFTFVYGTGLNVPVLDSKHFHFQLNQFQVSNQQAQTSTKFSQEHHSKFNWVSTSPSFSSTSALAIESIFLRWPRGNS